jgi:hypothetical protein
MTPWLQLGLTVAIQIVGIAYMVGKWSQITRDYGRRIGGLEQSKLDIAVHVEFDRRLDAQFDAIREQHQQILSALGTKPR